MAYEKCETDIMRRPPRNPQTDKIVNRKVIGQAYLQIGVIQCLAGYLAYFVVYAENGFFPKTLFYGLNGLFENAAKTDLVDSLGQEWVRQVYKRRDVERHFCAQMHFLSQIWVFRNFFCIWNWKLNPYVASEKSEMTVFPVYHDMQYVCLCLSVCLLEYAILWRDRLQRSQLNYSNFLMHLWRWNTGQVRLSKRLTSGVQNLYFVPQFLLRKCKVGL